MPLCKATLETRNFCFEAYGDTDEQARRALISGLRDHGFRYHVGSDWWQAIADEITYDDIELGVAYRDGEKIEPVSGGMHLSDPNSFKGAKR